MISAPPVTNRIEESKVAVAAPQPLGPQEKKDKKKKKEQQTGKPKHKSSKAVRQAAGDTWIDKSMEDWPENDYRIHCGNLGNEVTDELLAMAFKRYRSFLRARVIRDKRSSKTKGYGFVSLGDPQDFLAALREMNNKYIGNRPIRVTKSSWETRCLPTKKPTKKVKTE
eukprot:TRINITY_DN1294_c0_g2_i1.p1 TRINITY_DN1294_c0_g2~~TRINITY_DN1294_c0_g2_i1.p1  ORF type:complete len:168 (+),score=27.70 TRINITY_DN1294_c0_g2_i1:257-760(+)